jgi:hypothetical protein
MSPLRAHFLGAVHESMVTVFISNNLYFDDSNKNNTLNCLFHEALGIYYVFDLTFPEKSHVLFMLCNFFFGSNYKLPAKAFQYMELLNT